MRLFTLPIFVIHLVLGVRGQNITTSCITSGTVADCSSFAVQFCTSVNLVAIPPGGFISRCFNFGSLTCDFFTINGSTNSTTVISLNDCENAITAIKAACAPIPGQGGLATVGCDPIIYSMDPNNPRLGPNQCTFTSF